MGNIDVEDQDYSDSSSIEKNQHHQSSSGSEKKEEASNRSDEIRTNELDEA